MRHQRHVVPPVEVVRPQIAAVTDHHRVVRIGLDVSRPPARQEELADPRAVGPYKTVVVLGLAVPLELVLKTDFALTSKILVNAELALSLRVQRRRPPTPPAQRETTG